MRKTFLRVLKFLQIKEGGPNFFGELILQNVWITWSPLLYFNLKSFVDPNSMPFISFLCIFYDSGVLLSGFSNFCKWKRGDLISGRNQFCRMSELFGPSFCISVLKVLWTQILRHSLDFSPFCMNQEDFSQGPEILQIKEEELISRRNQFCRMPELFGPPFCISISKVSQTQILRHLLAFYAFCMIQE